MSGKRLKIAKRCFAVYHSFHHRLERLRPEDSSTFLETVSKDQIEKVETEILFEVRQHIRKYGWFKFAASYSLPPSLFLSPSNIHHIITKKRKCKNLKISFEQKYFQERDPKNGNNLKHFPFDKSHLFINDQGSYKN